VWCGVFRWNKVLHPSAKRLDFVPAAGLRPGGWTPQRGCLFFLKSGAVSWQVDNVIECICFTFLPFDKVKKESGKLQSKPKLVINGKF
jgi:hypothetical protein